MFWVSLVDLMRDDFITYHSPVHGVRDEVISIGKIGNGYQDQPCPTVICIYISFVHYPLAQKYEMISFGTREYSMRYMHVPECSIAE